MRYVRMPIEIESPEQLGYGNVKYNLAESSVTDTIYKNLNLSIGNLVLSYGHHVGKYELRSLIAAQAPGLKPDDVLLTAGAAAGLFIAASSLLSEKDHLVVMHPNYATNIETPKAIGSQLDYLELTFEEGFRPDLEKLDSLVRPNTKYISVTCPHNPTGTMLAEEELKKLISIAERHSCYLLVDETYRDLSFEKKLPVAASLSEKVISISSVSKAYGLPGIRLGWIITKDKKLQELFLAAKEQIYVCNSVVDEEIAYQYLLKKEEHFRKIDLHVKHNREVVCQWMKTSTCLEWIEPSGGVVCFPRIKRNRAVDLSGFYSDLNKKYQTFVGPGHWFEMDPGYMRIGFGWPSKEELKKGLENVQMALNESLM